MQSVLGQINNKAHGAIKAATRWKHSPAVLNNVVQKAAAQCAQSASLNDLENALAKCSPVERKELGTLDAAALQHFLAQPAWVQRRHISLVAPDLADEGLAWSLAKPAGSGRRPPTTPRVATAAADGGKYAGGVNKDYAAEIITKAAVSLQPKMSTSDAVERFRRADSTIQTKRLAMFAHPLIVSDIFAFLNAR